MKMNDKIFSIIRDSNAGKNVKIRYRKTSIGLYSLYLDYYHDGKREYDYPKKYIKGTKASYIEDNNTLQYILSYRDKKQLAILQKDTGLESLSENLNANFADYFKDLANRKTGSTQRKWLSVYQHLLKFSSGKILIKSVDKKFCRSFYNYLHSVCSYSTPRGYFKVFSAALNNLVLNAIIPNNPAKLIMQESEIRSKLKKTKERQREYLTIEELQNLIKTPINNLLSKDAFLFSCFTGLRLGDIRELIFAQLSNGYIEFKQHKTNTNERIKLSSSALQIITRLKSNKTSNNDKVFPLYENKALNKHLKRWIKDAGINKKITFHCGRHTFATMCLSSDIDIYTVSKLMGHKDLESTQIYAKLIDKKKDEAIDKLPEL